MKYGVTATTRPDSMGGRTVKWRCDRYGRPLAFDSEEKAREAAKAFNDWRGPFDDMYENTAAPLEEEKPKWNMELS